MSKKIMLSVTGVLVSGFVIVAILLFNGYAFKTQTKPEVKVETVPSEERLYQNVGIDDKEMLALPDIMDFIGDLDYLTEEEKMQLINDEKAAAPIYQKIELMETEIEKRSEEVLKAHASVLEEYNKLLTENQDLWEKMTESETKEQETATNNRDYINASAVLTEEEKQLLLQQEDKIESMDTKLDAIYAEVDEATKDLSQGVEDLYAEIDMIHSKSRSIWDKIYDNEARSDKMQDAVPY